MRPFVPRMALWASWCSSERWWIGCYERDAGCEMRDAEASGEARATHPASPIPHPTAPPACASEALSDSEPPRALMSKLPVILAITGASGAPYGVRLLEMLAVHHVPTWLLVSSHGWRLLTEECGIKDDRDLKKATGGERSEEHTSELQSRLHHVCRPLL